MLCPVCGKEMLVLEFELVEIDHCAECGGVWLDSGELALIGQRAGAGGGQASAGGGQASAGGGQASAGGGQAGALHGDLLAALESGQGEPDKAQPKRRCPVCRKRLLRARAGGARNIQAEKCPRGDGLWFEAGSLQAVIQAAGADSGNVFARFLADLDAHRGSAKVK